MKARNLIPLLQKGAMTDQDVVIVIDNSEEQFEVLSVANTPEKKIITVKLIEDKDKLPIGDSLENQEERAEAEATEEAKVVQLNTGENSTVQVTETVTEEVVAEQSGEENTGEVEPAANAHENGQGTPQDVQ